LVVDDMVGLFTEFHPKFVRRYAEVAQSVDAAIANYSADVRARRFPGPEHVFADKTPTGPWK
jgi:3-methyl-2-oxobutanoate hydroxymethyltransferase